MCLVRFLIIFSRLLFGRRSEMHSNAAVCKIQTETAARKNDRSEYYTELLCFQTRKGSKWKRRRKIGGNVNEAVKKTNGELRFQSFLRTEQLIYINKYGNEITLRSLGSEKQIARRGKRAKEALGRRWIAVFPINHSKHFLPSTARWYCRWFLSLTNVHHCFASQFITEEVDTEYSV